MIPTVAQGTRKFCGIQPDSRREAASAADIFESGFSSAISVGRASPRPVAHVSYVRVRRFSDRRPCETGKFCSPQAGMFTLSLARTLAPPERRHTFSRQEFMPGAESLTDADTKITGNGVSHVE